jgi:hypothetical protein
LSENIKELAAIFREHELATSPIEEIHELQIRINLPDMPNHHNLLTKREALEKRLSPGYEAATEGFKQLSVHDVTAKYQHLPPLTTIWEDDGEE